MIPKYPFEVTRTFAVGYDKRSHEVKSFETLLAAVGWRDTVVRKKETKRVVIRCIIDDWTPQTANIGDSEPLQNGNGHDPNTYRVPDAR